MNIETEEYRNGLMLHTQNVGGNLHMVSEYINRQDWAQYVLHLENVGMNTIVVYRMPRWLVHQIRREMGDRFLRPVDFDDPK